MSGMKNTLSTGKAKWFMEKWPYFAVACMGMICFILLYGYHVLVPTYTDWLLDAGDLSQHYLGWKAYRNGDWQFPIGLTDQLAYPSSTSIIFTDSIPLFAVFFKIFEFLLPQEFQYFGLWGIFSFALMGIFSYKVLSRFINNKITAICASFFFIVSPTVVQRMFGHTALAGQWVLLIALDNFFENQKCTDDRKTYIRWACLGILVSSIHVYFLLMCGIILAGSCLEEWLRTKRIKKPVIMLLSYCGSAAILIYILGGFSSNMQADNSGLGAFSFNLNALFNPQGWSKILKDLPMGAGQYEGFAYVGAAVLLMFVLSSTCLVISTKYKDKVKNNKTIIIGLIFVFIVALIVAMSDVITFNEKTLINYPLLPFVRKAWSIFRASGRIGWILVYLVMLYSICGTYYLFRGHLKTWIVIGALVLLQTYDISGSLRGTRNNFNVVKKYTSALQNAEAWEELLDNGELKHIVFGSSFQSFTDNQKWSLADWALSHSLTLNDFYFPRDNSDERERSFSEAVKQINDQELFIFNSQSIFTTLKYDMHYYEIDGFIVGTNRSLLNITELSKEQRSVAVYNMQDNTVINGTTENGKQ